MRVPIRAVAFGLGYYGGIQLPSRLFYKFSSNSQGVSHSTYASQEDMVSRFRLFEQIGVKNSKADIANYLTNFSTQPYTRDDMVDNLMLNALKEYDVTKMFRVKRAGKDKDPLFWHFGKIHGLENLAFVN